MYNVISMHQFEKFQGHAVLQNLLLIVLEDIRKFVYFDYPSDKQWGMGMKFDAWTVVSFFFKNVYKGMQILVFKFCRQMKQVSSMNNGMFNRHTKHTWSAKNTHLRRNTNNQIRDSIYVWCGIFDNWIIEQYFFKRYLNRQQNFFENQTLFHDTEIPLSRQQIMYFQQYVVSEHNSHTAVRHVNERYPNRWIGTQGPILWLWLSVDLTSLDFFLRKFLKDTMYSHPMNDVQEIQER